MESSNTFDVIIIGGSYAGLSAAMTLGRALRKVLIIDSGTPCNKQTPESHNFILADGEKPAHLKSKAKAAVLKYDTVQYIEDKALSASGENLSFKVSTASGIEYSSSKLLFATGIKDLMPDIEGFAECWGITVIHCPYCHGYEVRGRKTGIFAKGDMAYEFGLLINNWAQDLTLFSNGSIELDEDKLLKLKERNIRIEERPIIKLVHENGYLESVVFEDGSETLDAMYAKLPFQQHSDIPAAMGCSFTEIGLLQVDGLQMTSIPGVYASGDNTTQMRSLAVAMADGLKAGAFINHALVKERE